MSTLSDWWNNSWLGQIVQGLSDTFFGTTYGQQRLQQNQADINDFLSGKQRGWEEYMWNKSNAYNSPEAQMQRLRDAGLNPSLVYGQPISEAGVPAGAEGSVGLGSAQHGSITPESLMQLSLLQSQKENLDSQTNLNKAKASESTELAEVARRRCKEIDANINKLGTAAELDRALGQKATEETNKVLADLKLFNETYQDQVDIISNKKKLSKAEADNYKRECDARIGQLNSLANYYDSLKNLTDAQKEQVDKMKDILDDQKRIIKKQADVFEQYGSVQVVLSMINSTLVAVSGVVAAISKMVAASRGVPEVNISPFGEPQYSGNIINSDFPAL